MSLVPMPLDRGVRANLNVIDEELGCAPKGTLARRLGLLEQWPHLRLTCLMCRCEVLVQAQFGPR
jgi:hypothetical protein